MPLPSHYKMEARVVESVGGGAERQLVGRRWSRVGSKRRKSVGESQQTLYFPPVSFHVKISLKVFGFSEPLCFLYNKRNRSSSETEVQKNC